MKARSVLRSILVAVFAALAVGPADAQSEADRLDALSPDLRRWVEERCPQFLGGDLWTSCLSREIDALTDGKWPDLSALGSTERTQLVESCPRYLGPSLWRECAERQAAALGIALATTPHASPPPLLDEGEELAGEKPAPGPSSYPSLRSLPASMPPANLGPDLDAREVFRAVAPSVYMVLAGASARALQKGTVESQGSAVAISDRLALTNCHVVGASPYIVILNDETTARASVWGGDEKSDICVLESDLGLKAISAARSSGGIETGEVVYTIGNPAGLTSTLGQGIVSGIRSRDGLSYVQTTAAISPGSSGGALVDARGNLVGITTFLLRDAQSLNFAIAVEEFWRGVGD